MIFTSYFAKRSVRDSGLIPVAISLSVPKGFRGKRYLTLAPTREMINLAHDGKTEKYIKQYTEQILSRLDPQKVYNELDGCVLLCWEKSGSFCHRRLVAEWLEKGTGNRVEEFDFRFGLEM